MKLRFHNADVRDDLAVVQAVRDGRAQQICVIRGILVRLEEDPGVMDRVRKRARVLLAGAEK